MVYNTGLYSCAKFLLGETLIVAELIDGCQLKCALCPNRFRIQSKEQMLLSIVEKVLKKYKGRWIDWFNWGEPILHKDFLEIAEMVKGTPSRISTNLSLFLDDTFLKAMRKFRIVLISLSGMTKEVYQMYHQGGNFDLVMDNIRRLVSIKGGSGIVLNWLRHKYNEGQYELCKSYCGKLGIRFYPQLLVCTVEESIEGFDHELLMIPKFQTTRRSQCRIMDWDTIGVDGSYLLCCSSQNIKTGYTINDGISHEELVKAKMNMEICKVCQDKEFWRMYS